MWSGLADSADATRSRNSLATFALRGRFGMDILAGAAAFVDYLEHDGFANMAVSVCLPPYDAIRAEPAWEALPVRHRLKNHARR